MMCLFCIRSTLRFGPTQAVGRTASISAAVPLQPSSESISGSLVSQLSVRLVIHKVVSAFGRGG
jgi:hypothetical protein